MKRIVALIYFLSLAFCFAASQLSPVDLRCEYLKDPEGIDVLQPRLSWKVFAKESKIRGARQIAYQIIVASSAKLLSSDVGDMWDSGKVESDDSIHILYSGKPLESFKEYFWKVRIWDENGAVSKWSDVAKWSMGILNNSEWKAKWIGLDEKYPVETLGGASWIWFPEGEPEKSAPVGKRYFRKTFVTANTLPSTESIFIGTADNVAKVYLNGVELGKMDNFHVANAFNFCHARRAGYNVIAIEVENTGNAPNPAGLIGFLRLKFWRPKVMLFGDDPETVPEFQDIYITTDGTWKCSDKEEPGWKEIKFDDSKWVNAKELGKIGMPPWGNTRIAEDLRVLPARYLRKEFSVSKSVQRAVAYVSGLGLHELYINGLKVGDHVLSPALTEYDKRIFYVTHDVTENIRKGKNAIGVILGNGRFYAPRLYTPAPTRTFGYPMLLFQMRIEYKDGTFEEIVSDESWKVTNKGPIKENNEYDGEFYLGRLEMPGWNKPGFIEYKWVNANILTPPPGKLCAQMMEPIRVTQIIKPVAVTSPSTNVYIFDMGQNMVGWCRIKISGDSGGVISLRHAEILKPDGTLYMDNIRGAKVTDYYSLKGKGLKIYEPRFTYHGFRYVEIQGLTSKPKSGMIEGCVVHDDVEKVGEFTCSNPLINRIYSNIVWGVRGNYRSIPTDCPQRDERQGWLGDRSAESKGEMYMFNVAQLYRKWLQDMADAQKDNGSIPDVCPSYWQFYSDNVTWPSSAIIIPQAIYEHYADVDLLRRHYPCMKKWILYMSGFITNGLISRDSYGDWCVPPEDPKLIHTKDPKRITNKTLLASAYFYYDLTLMKKYATILGLDSDAAEFDRMAESLKKAFNEKFYNKEKGYYDNGTQTSCVLPLAFNMVPEGEKERVFNHLVWKIENESKGHIGTGLIGCQFINRVLTENGRPDLVYKMITQTDYPSFGYMIGKGATTIWELWNGDTADPAMNSHNHVMLVGDLVTWFYEYVAGIRTDPENPGFKRIILKPYIIDGLEYAKASYRSVRGLIVSNWQKKNKSIYWQVRIPPSTTALIYFPSGMTNIYENGIPVNSVKGLKFVKTENNRPVYEAISGDYKFRCD